MILSELKLDISHASVRQALHNCHDMHRNLIVAFGQSREEAGVLYRLIKKKEELLLYVLSKQQPDWKALLPLGYILIQQRDISRLTELYKDGAVLRFSLLASPCKMVKGDGKNSKRTWLKDTEERMDWLKRQGEKYGFELLEAHENGVEEHLFCLREGRKTIFSAVTFEGVLKISQSEAFWEAYQQGIGPEKAYGMGMLMLSKL